MSTIHDNPAYASGLDFMLRGEHSAAIASIETALVRYPHDFDGLMALGTAHQHLGETYLPPTMHERQQKSTLGDLASSILGLGVVAASRAMGQTDWIVQSRAAFRASIIAFEEAIEMRPESALPYHGLALSLRYLGQTDAAAEASKRAAELAPDNQEVVERASQLGAAAKRDIPRIPKIPGVKQMTWQDVVLPDRTKRELRQMQLLIENPTLSEDLGVEPPTGLLLYGPPGTGKTTIARVLASETNCYFLATSPAEINSMWLGESEKAVKRLFDEARAKSPAIIFLDEIDALLPVRSGGINQYSDKVVNQFLHEMDGLVRNKRIFVVGATNRRDMLDAALLRGGRLSREIEIPLPDLPARRALFALSTTTAKLAPDVDLDDLAERTEGYSGANIKAVVNEAGLQALIRLSESPATAPRILTTEDFDEAIANYKPVEEPEPVNPWKMFG